MIPVIKSPIPAGIYMSMKEYIGYIVPVSGRANQALCEQMLGVNLDFLFRFDSG